MTCTVNAHIAMQMCSTTRSIAGRGAASTAECTANEQCNSAIWMGRKPPNSCICISSRKSAENLAETLMLRLQVADQVVNSGCVVVAHALHTQCAAGATQTGGGRD